MASKMFHQGPINTAITSAIQQDRFLAFFITDNRDESTKWENIYLRSSEILPLLQNQSILLRLKQGSTEAAFVSAFCPVQNVPYMVIVKNGALVGSISNDVGSREEFVQRIKDVFPEEAQSSASTPSAPMDPTAALFAERRVRLEALEGRRKAQEKKEREERIAREKARREAESPARAKYVAEQRKIREDDLAEKRRILLLVEDDKIKRREKEARKKQAASARLPIVTPKPEPGPSNDETAISFRLLDGSILKSKFPSSSKLADVRRWLDLNRTDGPYPYNFQQILPNKSLTASDENSTLRALSFSQATTLVLVHHEA